MLKANAIDILGNHCIINLPIFRLEYGRIMKQETSIDLSGLICPVPVMRVRQKLNGLSTGSRLLVKASDPTTQKDIPQFCRFMGHELLENYKENDMYHYVIEKGSASEEMGRGL